MRLFISNFKDSNKFSAARALCFFALLCALLWLIGHIWVNQILIISERISDIRDGGLHKADAISIGNSHSVAIDFDELGLEHVPLWIPGGDLFETRVILEAVYESGAKPKWIFLTLNPFILLQDNGHSINFSNSQLLANRGRENAYLILREISALTIIRSDFIGFLRSNLIPLRVEGRQGSSILAYLKCTFKPTDRCTDPKFTFIQEAEPINTEFHPYYRFPILLSSVTPALKSNSTIIEESLNELRKIQQLASQHGSHFVLLESPLSQWYVTGMLEGLMTAEAHSSQRAIMRNRRAIIEEPPILIRYYDRFINWITLKDNLKKEIPNPFHLQEDIMRELAKTNHCIILPGELWQHNTDGMQEDWFADLLHLNNHGAVVFTNRLKSYLDNTGCKLDE